jgi:hypothetical protein
MRATSVTSRACLATGLTCVASSTAPIGRAIVSGLTKRSKSTSARNPNSPLNPENTTNRSTNVRNSSAEAAPIRTSAASSRYGAVNRTASFSPGRAGAGVSAGAPGGVLAG